MMKRKIAASLMIAALIASCTACGSGEETTLTGMVLSVDGTVLSLVEMDAANMSVPDFAAGETPEMPEGMEGFSGFDPNAFEGTLPEGETFPQWNGDGELPQMPEGEVPEFPEGETRPQMPEDGKMPNFGGENSDELPGFGGFGSGMETTDVDIGDAHISIEIDEGKAGGSLEDITVGCFVTITRNGKGEVTNVLVSSQTRFGGARGMQQGTR